MLDRLEGGVVAVGLPQVQRGPLVTVVGTRSRQCTVHPPGGGGGSHRTAPKRVTPANWGAGKGKT